MEGPVLTESEVWKVGLGTNTSDRIDFSPLMNDESLKKESDVQEETCSNIEEPSDPELTPDQIKSVIPQEMRSEEDLSSTQTEARSEETSEPACKQEMCHIQAEYKNQPDLNQEITILVTNHDCTLEDDENEDLEEQKICHVESKSISSTEPIEEESQDGSIVVANVIEVSQVQKARMTGNMSTEQNTNAEEPKPPGDQSREVKNNDETDLKKAPSDSNLSQTTDASSTGANANTEPRASVEVCGLKDQTKQPEGEEITIKLKETESTKCRNSGRPPQETLALTRSPGRQQHIQTQVSLEVMYQSVATSPMTPQEGSSAFLFPSSFGKLGSSCTKEAAPTTETKDAELQVSHGVEFRSVATAPMTPTTLTAPEFIPEPEPRIGVTAEQPEPVQEVSWDEKGMTWEVYGAVVEVTVLGTAIQKHLEKKQKKLSTVSVSTDAPQSETMETSVPIPSSPPPILEPSECSPIKEHSLKIGEKEENGGRPRRNVFRRWFRNVRRPSCCSRPRQNEEN
ncbi:G protein-regulated inducer of neurite outgrowth 1 [Triplophysa dalaica]|uniref:G protein-regulated inducer of neurite outgrowth 1 n=1 Tax=Triplophysa dalaica TaxID=1582913 RepID=UPI0024E01CDC|nr:G protein-regulated inducer of neurite outgrowth 1 [Triplophysa dalaica]